MLPLFPKAIKLRHFHATEAIGPLPGSPGSGWVEHLEECQVEILPGGLVPKEMPRGWWAVP